MSKLTQAQLLAIRCPTCGASPKQKCELASGHPHTNPHRDRRLDASDVAIRLGAKALRQRTTVFS